LNPRERDRAVRYGWFLVDLACTVLAAFAAAWVRYDLDAAMATGSEIAIFGLLAALIYSVTGLFVGPYRIGHVRGSFEETVDIARAMTLAALVLAILRLALGVPDIPRSLPFTTPIFALLGMFTLRFVVRSWRWGRQPVREQDVRAIVFGAGHMGRQLVRSLHRDTSEGDRYVPVALLDDDHGKRRLSIDGLRVAGTRDDITAVAERTQAKALIIAATTMDGGDLREISELARLAGLDVLILPPVNQLFHAPRGADLRHLNLEDLLGRQRIELDQTAIRNSIAGKRVLVTGAGGSIGSELCRQIDRYGPAKLVLLDRDESAMHSAQMSMTGRALLDDGTLALCDIRDPNALRVIFEREQPQVVFHAAALKHLTLLEQFPAEAWKTNVLGTLNVLEAARAVGVETFVNVSTDKAAWPSSVLGYSKRLAERLTASFATTSNDETYVSVRFGNVLGSRGSVITAFTAQIERGGPVTVTHPDVERFFMLIPEACQLVLQASAIGADGEVMVLAMGKPVKIVEVARTLIEMSGKHNVEIQYTGLRPGEKLSEQLFTPGEEIQTSEHPLVSHVGVPSLDASVVRGQRFSTPEQALDWMVENSGGHRDHDPSADIDITAEGPILGPDGTPNDHEESI
jgi:FlaA1/EpsC-like NDP-sugar epimerase